MQVTTARFMTEKTSPPGRDAFARFMPASPAISSQPAIAAGQIVLEISGQVAVVRLNRPQARNAMTLVMWQSMPALMAVLQDDPQVRVIVVTGSGEDFCAGADITEFGRIRDDVAQATAYEVAVDACCDAITGVAKPTIAVIRGYCLGGGAHLAMSCDFRYSAHGTQFGIPAARLSIVYGVSATRKLLNLVGLNHAKRILFSGERFGAAQAWRIGFVDHVAPKSAAESADAETEADDSDPMQAAGRFAATLAANAPLSIAGAKAILNGLATDGHPFDDRRAALLIDAAAASADYREGRAAFAEKRSPVFAGR